MDRERILELLQTLPANRKLEIRGDSAWICCPLHSNGMEKTPSFKITLDGSYAGSGFCFACSAHGGWKDTVRVLGFPPASRFAVTGANIEVPLNEAEFAALVGERTAKTPARVEYREAWPSNTDWRGVSGKLIKQVGGTMVLGGDGREPILRLPAMVRGVEAGFIDCKINPPKGDRLKYINAKNSSGWSKDILFPFDYVRSLEPRVLAIVEGPRDALCTIQNGLPALATLGSFAWNEKCARLVLAIAPSILVLLLDPDDAGEGLRRHIYEDLCDRLDVRSIRLPSKLITDPATGLKKRVKLIDPADLNRPKLARVLTKIGVNLDTIIQETRSAA